MDQHSKSDHYLVRLKVALAAGGLVATMLGAALLGRAADALSVDTPLSNVAESAVSANSVTVEGEELDLSLEAIPTVAAPAFRGAPLAFGRSSG